MKFQLLAVCTLLALIGCNDEAGNNDNNGNGGTVLPVPQHCLSLIAGEPLCLPEKITGQSGQRVHIPLTGKVHEDMIFDWNTAEVEGISMPIFMPADNGAYVVLPRTTMDVSLTLNVEGKLGSSFDSVAIPIDVTGGTTLILNGINLVSMNTDGLLDIEWLPAVNDQGVYANDVTYSLTLTKLVDGKPSNDVRTLRTSRLTETVDVEFDASYRLVLSVEDSNGNVTFSEHLDYNVPGNKPELQEVLTVTTTKDLPSPSSLELYSLLDVDGVLKIVREMENGEYYFDNAMSHEIFKVTNPLKVAMRLKELEAEEISAYLQLQRQVRQFGHADLDVNSFTIDVSGEYERLTLKGIREENLGKLCQKLEYSGPGFSKIEGTACASKFQTSMCETDVSLSPELVIEGECKLSSNFEVKLEAKFEAESEALAVYWPGTNMIKKFDDIKYVEDIELTLGTRVGAKMKVISPKLAAAFKSSVSINGDIYFGMDSWWPDFNVDVSANTQKIFDPLSEDWITYEYPSSTIPSEFGVELQAGIFPRFALSDINIEAEVAAKLAMSNKLLGISMVTNDTVPGVNVMPSVTTVDAAINGSAVGAASVNLNQILPSWAPNFKGAIEYETPLLKIYEHPKKVTFNVKEQRSCFGNNIYAGDDPIDLSEYGTLNKGDKYGTGWQFDEWITIPPKEDLVLDSFNVYGPGANLITADHSGSTVTLSYNTINSHAKKEATLLYKFIKPDSFLQKAFPIYSVSKYTINQGEDTSAYPWVCWGSAYKVKESIESTTMSLEKAANIGND